MNSANEDKQIDEQILKKAILDNFFLPDFMEKEEESHYEFSHEETGDGVWIFQTNLSGYTASKFEEELKSGFRVIPRLVPFDKYIPLDLSLIYENQGKIRRKLKENGENFARELNQTLIDVLVIAAQDKKILEISDSKHNLNEFIAEASDRLVENGVKADRFLFPEKFKNRLLTKGFIKKDEDFSSMSSLIFSPQYVGKTINGLYAFCFEQIPDDLAFIVGSDQLALLYKEPIISNTQNAFTLEIQARVYLNPIVKNTQAVLALKGIEMVLKQNLLPNTSQHASNETIFVDLKRISDLEAIDSPNFDLSKLIKLCKELNVCFEHNCFYAVAMLTRAILDHIPPIFNFSNFDQVVNNYSGGKSFKKAMKNLQDSLRNIADIHLHSQVSQNEPLPNRIQVNFSHELDLLLSEIIRQL